MVGDTGFEPVTSSVSRKRAPTAPIARSWSCTCEVETGFEPVYTALQAVASPLGHSTVVRLAALRADDEIRTRDPHLGKVMRYQLRYIRLSRPAFGERPTDENSSREPAQRANRGAGSPARHEVGFAARPVHFAAAVEAALDWRCRAAPVTGLGWPLLPTTTPGMNVRVVTLLPVLRSVTARAGRCRCCWRSEYQRKLPRP